VVSKYRDCWPLIITGKRWGKIIDSLYCEESEHPIFAGHAEIYKNSKNRIFNHNFIYPNNSGDFPAGWQKGRGSRSARFFGEQDSKHDASVQIRNSLSHRLASICQQRSYSIPVYEKQVWEFGAILRGNRELSAVLKVNYISRSSSRILYSSLDIMIDPVSDYYYGIVTVPAGIDYALVEVGTSEIGTLTIEDVVFKRVFPAEKYDMDARGRLNINTVDAVKKIIDPITIKGNIDLKKESRDVVEDVIAGPEVQVSGLQDVLHLSTYSFGVINQGDEDALAEIQLSPNGSNWVEDAVGNGRIEAGQLQIFVSSYFLRYIRLKYWTESNNTTDLQIYFQGQG